MHVLHVDRQRSLTGQVRRGLIVARAARERGHEVSVIAHPGAGLARRAREAGLRVLELPLRGPALYPSVARAALALRGRRVDLLHCHGARDHTFAWHLARLLRTSRAARTPAGLRAPCVIRTKHNHTPPRGPRSLRRYRACAKVIAVSEFVRGVLLEGGLPPDLVETIPDGVDTRRFSPRPRDPELARALGIGPDDRVIGNVSSLHERKGIDDVLHAFAQLHKGSHGQRLRCLLVGGNREPWAGLARQLGIADRVILPGQREDVPAMLSLIDVYVLTSRHEALGTSVLEAMAMERPVVVSDTGGLAESVTRTTGIRVSAGDVDALAVALSSLLDDPERARGLGAAARERVIRHFSDEALVDRTLALYARVRGGSAGA